jgi:hypothetical protein
VKGVPDLPIANIEGIPVKYQYHDFAVIFSKQKADKLAFYSPYDFKINIKEGTNPLLGMIYSLSQSEIAAILEFLMNSYLLGLLDIPSLLRDHLFFL